jgi:hypothetical protein
MNISFVSTSNVALCVKPGEGTIEEKEIKHILKMIVAVREYGINIYNRYY